MKTSRQIFLITLCAILIFFLVGSPAYLLKGSNAIFAAVITVGACWTGAIFGILAIKIFRSTLKREFPWFIMGGIFRMGVPFAVALVVVIGAEKDFGFLVLILFPIVYLLMLPVDVLTALPEKNNANNESVNNIHNS